MSKLKRYKTVIEIEHSNFKDASIFVQSLRTATLQMEVKKSINDMNYSITNRVIHQEIESIEKPKEVIINGNRCLVFRSKMNKDE